MINAVFMPEFFRVLGVSRKIQRTKKKTMQKISSLEKDGISGDQGFRSSGLAELAIFPAKKLSYKTAHLLLNSIFPA
ncbi:MAG: hypothetical protein WBE11_08460, partial [Candidatus Aminicenantaceae bacterium]